MKCSFLISDYLSSIRKLSLGLLATGLTACVSTPGLDTSSINSKATPSQVTDSFPNEQGNHVRWGGQIISISNKENITQLQILAYPLASRDGYPNTYRKPIGRFILKYAGFLEPEDYSPGEVVTAVGVVTGLTPEVIEGVSSDMPLLDSDQLKLWPRPQERNIFYPTFGFGISFGF